MSARDVMNAPTEGPTKKKKKKKKKGKNGKGQEEVSEPQEQPPAQIDYGSAGMQAAHRRAKVRDMAEAQKQGSLYAQRKTNTARGRANDNQPPPVPTGGRGICGCFKRGGAGAEYKSGRHMEMRAQLSKDVDSGSYD